MASFFEVCLISSSDAVRDRALEAIGEIDNLKQGSDDTVKVALEMAKLVNAMRTSLGEAAFALNEIEPNSMPGSRDS
jgi:hypothetical protein